jgi:hypothetical protein
MLVRVAVSTIVTLVLCGAVTRTEAGQPEIGWQMNLSDPTLADKLSGKSLRLEKSRREVSGNFRVTVAGGVLRVTGRYGTDGTNQGDNVHFVLPLGKPIDLTKYPVFEIEWRTNAPQPQGCLLVQNTAVTRTGDDASSYYYPSEGKPNEWHTDVNQYVPDASFPTRGTAVKLSSVSLAIYGWGPPGEYTVEIRSLKIRGLNEAEAVADAAKTAVFRDFRRADTPRRWTEEVFPFGPCGYCRGPEGYESWYDTVVRHHGTASLFHYSQLPNDRGVSRKVPVEEYIAFRRRELAPATARGLYIQPLLRLPEVMKNVGPEALPWLHEYVGALAKAFRNEKYLMGWFIADEISDDFLWGIAATEDAINRTDPSKIAAVNHFGIERIMRFEPYLNVVMTDYYPIVESKRDPWSYAGWCRSLSEKTDKPHWIFIPSFGKSDWFETDSCYAYPTRAELRLMTYLALANGIKGITYFIYSSPSMYPGMFDAIGNPLPLADPLAADVSKIGEKLAEVGPFLLKTKLLPVIAAKATPGGSNGLGVGVRRSDEGLFVVVANQHLAKEQSGTVELSVDKLAPDASIYDLYALSQIAKQGVRNFEVAQLAPGDGRIYYVGSRVQFEAIKRNVLERRALEMLRVANLDRLVAERWGMDVTVIDAQFAKARSAAQAGSTAQAQEAKDMVAAVVTGDNDLARCRRLLAETKITLGRAYFAIHKGFASAWPGCASMLNAPNNLADRFGPLQEDYYLGKKDGLSDKLRTLLDEGKSLLDKADVSGSGRR